MNTIERNLIVFEARCLVNQHEFEVYEFSDFVYGERLVRTVDGQEFALLTTHDLVAKETGRLLDDIYHNQLDERDRAAHFNRVFGLTCDPLNGKQLDASVRIICPICQTSQVSHWETKPRRFRSFSIPVISHEKWSKMNHEQQRLLIEKALRDEGLL
jgi:hypothetical protein